MKVHELIDLLQKQDPDATVYTMSQPSWPFEYSITGVAAREDFTEDEEEFNDEKHANDVFIVEGTQLRYGRMEAWDATKR